LLSGKCMTNKAKNKSGYSKKQVELLEKIADGQSTIISQRCDMIVRNWLLRAYKRKETWCLCICKHHTSIECQND
jgi:hypothetical protein